MFVSIIIPVRNGGRHIRDCLDQIFVQDYSKSSYEVIVADGGSNDDSLAIVEDFIFRGYNIRILKLDKTGRAYGLNRAIEAAKGSMICRLDVRSKIDTSYISSCLQVAYGKTLLQKAIGWAMTHPFGAGNAKFKTAKKSGYVDSVYLGFFRREIFDRIGYFDESGALISEDSDINERIRAVGGGIYLNISIAVGYFPRETITEQFRLYYRYGIARVGNFKRNGRFTSWRQLVAPGFVAALVVLGVSSFFSHSIFMAFGCLVIFYGAADFTISLEIALRHKNLRAFIPLILIFPSMHFAWGLGFWRALIFGVPRDNRVAV
jgi:succinoglycan biosynthesis protein ExoA